RLGDEVTGSLSQVVARVTDALLTHLCLDKRFWCGEPSPPKFDLLHQMGGVLEPFVANKEVKVQIRLSIILLLGHALKHLLYIRKEVAHLGCGYPALAIRADKTVRRDDPLSRQPLKFYARVRAGHLSVAVLDIIRVLWHGSTIQNGTETIPHPHPRRQPES